MLKTKFSDNRVELFFFVLYIYNFKLKSSQNMYWHVGKKQLQMVIYKTKVLERNITNKQTKANSKYDIKKHNYNRLIKNESFVVVM